MAGNTGKTKLKIASSLKELMKTYEFSQITVNMICNEADISRRSFYRHFIDKYDLLRWIFDQDFCFDFDEHPDWNVGNYFPLFAEIMYKDREFYKHAYKISGQNGFREHAFKWLYPVLSKDFGECFSSEESKERFLQYHMDAIFNEFVDWLQSEECSPPEEFVCSHGREWFLFGMRIAETYGAMLMAANTKNEEDGE